MTSATWRPFSIGEIAAGVAAGSRDFDPAVREFLDSWQAMDGGQRARALVREPILLGSSVQDACLAALAEHLALSAGIPVPEWTEGPTRFLSEPFFAGGLESLKAMLIVESPLAFRRRLIFISADRLYRPQRASAAETSDA